MLVDNNVYINKYVADGSTASFPIAFPFLEASHIEVYTRGEDGEDTLVNPSTYTITGAGIEAGGTLTFNTSPSAGTVIAIIRNVPITQLYAYTELDNFPAESHENALAKLTMIDQQQAEILGRAFVAPITSGKTGAELFEDVKNELEDIKDDAVAAKYEAIENATAAAEKATNAAAWATMAGSSASDAATSATAAATSATAAQATLDQVRQETIGKIDNVMVKGEFIVYDDIQEGESDTVLIGEKPYKVGSDSFMLFDKDGNYLQPKHASYSSGVYEELGTVGELSNLITLDGPVSAFTHFSYQIIGLNAASLVDDNTVKWDADTGISVNAEAVLGDVHEIIREDVAEIIDEDYHSNVISSKDFGIKGDGETDDTISMAAMDAFIASHPDTPMMYQRGLYLNDDAGKTRYVGKTTISNVDIDGFAKALKQKPDITHFIHDETDSIDANFLNGAFCDGDYLYSVIVKVVDNVNIKQFVQRIDLSSGYIDYLDSNQNALAVVEHNDLGHANSMTSDGEYLYIAPGSAGDQFIAKLDKKTLQTVQTYDISATAGNFGGIAYNDQDGLFYVRGVSDTRLHIYNASFEQVGTQDITYPPGYSLQDICFKDGDLYGFAFTYNASDTREYYHYLIKFDISGKYSQAWLLDISREIENLCTYKDDFLVGTNTAYGSRYDFYRVSIQHDVMKTPEEIMEHDRDINDYASGLSSQCQIKCKKRLSRTAGGRSSAYKLVGTGKDDAEFSYLEDAMSYAKRIDRMNYHTRQIVLQCSGDFSDRSYEISGIKTKMVFSVISGATAKLGPLVITDCNCVQLWNGSISIELSDATKTESVVAGISAVNSFVLAGVDITNTASPKTGTIGIYSQRGAVVEIPQNITLTNFATGVSFYNGSFIQDDASQITFTDCTAKFTGTRRGIVHVDADNAPAILASPQASVATPVNNLMSNDIRISADGNTKYTHIYRRGDGTNYKGALMESVSGSTTGAYLILRDPDSPAETGWFNLAAKDSSNTVMLLGKPDGSLLWNGNPVQTTSDERKKTMFSPVPDAILDAWGEVDWEQFKYLAAIEEKGGAENCRWHSGLVAQHVQNAFEALGQDACTYGILCHEEWDEEYEEKKIVDVEARHDEFGNEVVPEQSHIERTLLREAGDLWTVRYTEALCMEAAYQRRRADRAETRLAALERRLDELEAILAR